MKHTPGPWLVYDKEIVDGIWIDCDHDEHILNICKIEGCAPDLMRANAHLIAAAPDLLAACEAALFRISLNRDGASVKLAVYLEAAVKKARGEK